VAQLGHLGIHAWGDSGWKHAERYGVKHRGYAGHFKELNYIYSLSQVNVDVGRIYQSDIVPMRIFDILSCGGFVLAEYTPALEELFVLGEELVVWRDQADLQQKAAYYLDHPQIARSIALAGRARVCRDHRIKDRIHEMLEVVSRANPKPKALSLAG
jgi:spore maturation protein CgeB